MDRLEGELGLKLIERSSVGVTPTPSGELVYAHACQIRDEMQRAESRLQNDQADTAVITVGALPSLSNSVLPLAAARWKERYPDVLLRVLEKVQVELLLGLHRGEFDFIIGQTEFFNVVLEGLKQRVLFRDRLCVYARQGHPLFSVDKLSWSQLVTFPWVCPMVGWAQRTVLEKLLAAEGVEPPRQLVECGSIGFTKSLIATSDHLGMLPAHCAAGETAIRALPITLSALKRDIAVIFRERAPLSAASQELVAQVEAAGTELSAAHA